MLNLRFHSVSFQHTLLLCVRKHHHHHHHHHKNCSIDLGLFCSTSIDWKHYRSRVSRRRALNTEPPKDNNNNNMNNDIQREVNTGEDEEETNKINLNNNNNVKWVDLKNQVLKIQQAVISIPPLVIVMQRQSAPNFAIGLSALATILVVAVRAYVVKKSRNKRPGTVADLVRRGQLKNDRRGISAPLKYDDPFNNPMVKVGKSNSTVEMCGKVYRMAPVTLTREQQAIHQKRRSRAYEWKRPTVFLKEGDPIPPDVDLETIRWIPANHPFATTASDIDEDLAQNNVNLKHGVPFRVQAEHYALQKKLEALQSEQKLNKLVIDPSDAKDFERPFKPHQKSDELVEPNASIVSKFSESEDATISPSGNDSSSKEDEVPKT